MNKKNKLTMKITGVLIIGIIAVVAALNTRLSMQEESLSSIVLENIEALAQESDGSCSGCRAWMWGPGSGLTCVCGNQFNGGICYSYCQ
ncbi:MAG: hypothetical protein LBK58_06225 [Prevotellaceae bacterium]|jgi:hypothetical protein|nr:hypothetical protein [Prevotellaceae bacterium]